MLRQRNDAWPTAPIAAGTLHTTKGHTDGGFWIARLNTQIQINDGATTVAGDNQPVMF
jgi:hypothetical protein